MKPVLFEGYDVVLGAPPGWDVTKHGECGGLPIMRTKDGLISQWELSTKDRDAIAGGARVYLSVVSEAHPVVWMKVGKPVDEKAADSVDLVIVGGGTCRETLMLDATTGIVYTNIRSFVLYANAITGHLVARLEVIGHHLQHSGKVILNPIGLKCVGVIGARIAVDEDK